MALFLALIAGVAIGPLQLAPTDVLEIIGERLGIGAAEEASSIEKRVVWDIRVPRVLLAILVGSALAVSGAALQGLFGNSLADPGIIGVTGGASLGAITAIVLGLTVLGSWTVPGMAFIFGVATTGLIYALARPGRNAGTVQLLLVGIAISAIAGSANGFFTYIADTTELESITYWSMGSLNRGSWDSLAAGVPLYLIGVIMMLRLAKPLDVLALGEREAHHVGLNVKRTRILIIISTAMVVGSAVALAGSIGFVGLVVPHIVRMLIGPGHLWLLPISAVGGALMLVLTDIGARTLNPPSEIPIGLFTGLIGGPFFLWLLFRKQAEIRA